MILPDFFSSIKRIFIVGYYGFGNLGDELSVDLVKSAIKNKNDNVVVTVLVKEKLCGQDQNVGRNNLLGIFLELLRTDCVCLGSGSLLQDRTSFASFFYYWMFLVSAKILRKKTVLLGQGIGPIRTAVAQSMLNILCYCDFISVRDKNSLNFLNQRFPQVPAVLCADPLWEVSIPRLSCDKRPALVWIYRDLPDWNRVGEKQLSVLLARFLKERKAILQLLVLEPQRDQRSAKTWQRELERLGATVEWVHCSYPDWQNIWTALFSAQLVVAMRLHGAILALLTGTPTLAFSIDPKFKMLRDCASAQGWVNVVEWNPDEWSIFVREMEKMWSSAATDALGHFVHQYGSGPICGNFGST